MLDDETLYSEEAQEFRRDRFLGWEIIEKRPGGNSRRNGDIAGGCFVPPIALKESGCWLQIAQARPAV